ncbi:MAG: hypothetical protein NTV05_12575 [Acidobacteria bacterium]|nr:hypothetical protein [Acidobacteriota bacterium]
MNINRATATGVVMLALAVSAIPALAASSDQNGRDRRQGQTARVQPNNGGSATRAQANSDRANGRQARGAGQAEAPRDVAVQRVAPRVQSSAQTAARQTAPRQYDTRQTAPRQYDTRQYASRQYDTRQYASRQYDTRRYDNRSYSNGGYGGYSGYGYRPYISRPRVRFGLGISIFAGSPYGFRFDYGWAPSYAYRFPMRQGIGYGGMSFLIDPDDAAVYVDGQFIGIARDFDGQPVPLAAGMHEIELQAEGCEPVAFDITVRPGQVIPYRGSLMAYR